MFKNCTAFKIASDETRELLNHEDLADTLEAFPPVDPEASAWRRVGFGKPDHFGESVIFDNGLGARVFFVEARERVLPGRVIKRAVAEKIGEIERRENRKASRKEYAQIKDAVTADLLPHAFIKASGVHMMVCGVYLFIESTSTKVCDEALDLLRTACDPNGDEDDGPGGPIELKLLEAKDAGRWLKSLALGTENVSFKKLDSVVLQGEHKAMIRVKDLDLEDDNIVELVTGNSVRELAVAYSRTDIADDVDIHCAITDSLLVKRLKFSDVLLKQSEQDAANETAVSHFDANVAIVSDVLRKLFLHIESELAEWDDDL